MIEILPDVLAALAFAWLLFLAAQTIRRLLRRGCSATDLVIAFYCLVSLAPIVQDTLLGVPRYSLFPGLRAAETDPATNVIYYIYLMAAPVPMLAVRSFWRYRPIKWRDAGCQIRSDMAPLRIYMVALLVCPAVYFLVAAPDYRKFLSYAIVLEKAFTYDDWHFYNTLNFITYFCLFGAIVLLVTTRRLWFDLLLVTPFLAFANYTNGKRNIVFFSALCCLLALRISKRIRTPALVCLLIVFAGAYAAYNAVYQDAYRNYVFVRDVNYDSVRLDWGRDADVKLALFSELNSDTASILEYRCETLIFNTLFFVPRVYWDDKPWPYSYYITARAMQVPYQQLKWGLTTSILGEAVANLGWFGCIAAPVFLACLGWFGDRAGNAVMTLFTAAIAILSLMLMMPNFLPILLVWLVLVARDWRAHARAERRPPAGYSEGRPGRLAQELP